MDTGLHPADSSLAALIFSFPQCFTCQHNYSMKSSPVGLILLDKVVHRVAIKSALFQLFILVLKHWFNSACSLNPVMIQELSSNEQLGSYSCKHLLWEEKCQLEIKIQSQAAKGLSL